MKRGIVAIIICLMLSASAVQLSAASKKVYIKTFTAEGEGTADMALDIKDYMAEVFTQKLSLITDDEIKEYLANAEFTSTVSSDQENSASKLLKSIDVNYLVYGKIYRDAGEYVIDATMLELSDDRGVTKKNFGDIRFAKPIYNDRASRSLASFLLADRQKIRKKSFFGPKDPRDTFKEEVEDVEADMKEIEEDYKKGSASIKSASKHRDDVLIHSPLLRAGFGGFGSMKSQNKEMNELYSDGMGGILDFFFYRYKDPVGDGIDMYVRGIAKKYTLNTKALDAGSIDAVTAKYNVGVFEGMPDISKKAFMYQYGGDLGLRIVGSTYFLYEAWSLYINGAIRYLFTDERYTVADKAYKKRLNGWGFNGGLGLEVSLFPNAGLFAEANYGYCPVGRSNFNVDGFQAFGGITIRTNHWF